MPKRTATGCVIRDEDESSDDQLSDVDEDFLQAHERSMSDTAGISFKREASDEVPSTAHTTASTPRASVPGKAIKRDRGTGIDKADKTHGRTQLHRAAAKGDLEKATFLLDSGAEISRRSNADTTPLHEAATNGQFEVVKLLIERGAFVEPRDSAGDYPLLDAAQNEDFDICRLLLEAGANPTLQNKQGCSALSEADEGPLKEMLRSYSDKFKSGQSLEQKQTQTRTNGEGSSAARGSNSPAESPDARAHRTAPRLAKGKSVQIDKRGAREVDSFGRDALHNCVLDGDEELVEEYLEIQFVDFRDKDKCTPLHSAARLGNARICSLLLEKGAKHSARNSIGNTPLHEACYKKDNRLVMEALLEAGASLTTENSAHLTALQLAELELGEDAKETKYLRRQARELEQRSNNKRQQSEELPEMPRRKRGRPSKESKLLEAAHRAAAEARAQRQREEAEDGGLVPLQQESSSLQASRHASPVRRAPQSPIAARSPAGHGTPTAASTPLQHESPQNGALQHALSPSIELSPTNLLQTGHRSPASPLRQVLNTAPDEAAVTRSTTPEGPPPAHVADSTALVALNLRLDSLTELVRGLANTQTQQLKQNEQDAVERQKTQTALESLASATAGVRQGIDHLAKQRPAASQDDTVQLAGAVKSLTEVFERSQVEMVRVIERQAAAMDRLTQDTQTYMRTLLIYLQQPGYAQTQVSAGHGANGGHNGQHAVNPGGAPAGYVAKDAHNEHTPPISGSLAGRSVRSGSSQPPPPHAQHYGQPPSAVASSRPPLYSPQQQQMPGPRGSIGAVPGSSMPLHAHDAHLQRERSPSQHGPSTGSQQRQYLQQHGQAYGPAQQHRHAPQQQDGYEYSDERRAPLVSQSARSSVAASNDHVGTSLPSVAQATGLTRSGQSTPMMPTPRIPQLHHGGSGAGSVVGDNVSNVRGSAPPEQHHHQHHLQQQQQQQQQGYSHAGHAQHGQHGQPAYAHSNGVQHAAGYYDPIRRA